MGAMLRKIVEGCLFFLKKQMSSSRATIAGDAKIYWDTKFYNSGTKQSIRIGHNSLVRGGFMIFGHGGDIQVGDNCYIGHNTYIWSAKSIKIGDRVLISHGVNIHDNNSHPVNAEKRHQHFMHMLQKGHPTSGLDLNEKAIVIEDDAWIGFNATILKGITVGKGAIVAACSVVTKDVSPFTIVAGNPAKMVKTISQDSDEQNY